MFRNHFLPQKSAYMPGFWVETSPSFVGWDVLCVDGEPRPRGSWLCAGGPAPACDGCQMCRLAFGCLAAPPGCGGGWRADGGEITPPWCSDKYGSALPLIKRLILEFEIGI